jgi:putative membrane protein
LARVRPTRTLTLLHFTKEITMKRFIATVLSAVLLVPVAQAAETTASFVTKASESGMAEIEFGRLAAEKGGSPAVRAYGQRMVADHGKADAELKPLAEKKQLPLAKTLKPEHQKALETMRAKNGAEFDAAFAQQMVADHNEAVALFTAASSLPDAELAAFAAKTLPTLREHQKDAASLHAAR